MVIRASILNVTLVLILCLSGRALWAAEWIWAENLALGSPLPQFNVVNVDDSLAPVQNLYGKKGLLLYFNRSTQWWPYCIRQLVELSKHASDIRSKGVNVAAVSYDSPVELKRFSVKYGITFPLLSDPESSAIIQLGLLNTNYDASTKYYGVPYPGVFLVDSKGIIIDKFAEQGYRDRPLMVDLIRSVNELDWGFAHYLWWPCVGTLATDSAARRWALLYIFVSFSPLSVPLPQPGVAVWRIWQRRTRRDHSFPGTV